MGIVDGGATVAVGVALTDLNVFEVWTRYVAMGGSLSPERLVLYLSGYSAWPVIEHNAAAHALNEALHELDMGHPVAYADEVVGVVR